MRTSVDVHNFLVERDIPHEVFAARGRLRSAERMAAVLELPRRDVGRVAVYEGRLGPVAALVPVERQIDLARLRRAVADPALERVTLERASELTGYLPESVPPAGLPSAFRIVVDPSFHRDVVLYFPGGEARAVLKVRGTDLVRGTRARVVSITRPRRGRRG